MNHKTNLVNSAHALLTFIAELSLIKKEFEIEECQLEAMQIALIRELALFKKYLKAFHTNKITQESALYCLTTAIDETIMNSSLKLELRWSKYSLLNHLYNENWGGERFYLILKYALKNQNTQMDVIELIYLLLSLGYRGKFHKNGKSSTEPIKNHLVKILNAQHGIQDNNYLIKINDKKPLDKTQLKKLMNYFSLSFLLLILLSFFAFNTLLNHYSQPYLNELKFISTSEL